MTTLKKPSSERVRRFLERQSAFKLSYTSIGATAVEPPPGYTVDRTRVRLGAGASVYEAAKVALQRWEQFNLGWVQAWCPGGSIEVNAPVGVAGKFMGLWWLNACRVIYVVEEQQENLSRSGFAYGTLPDHAAAGEERFLIEWDRTDDSVWYDILAFSRPRKLIARLGIHWVRRLQKRFGRDSSRAMMNAVRQAT